MAAMLRLGLISKDQMLRYFERVAPDLYRYPAIDPAALREAVHAIFRGDLSAIATDR